MGNTKGSTTDPSLLAEVADEQKALVFQQLQTVYIVDDAMTRHHERRAVPALSAWKCRCRADSPSGVAWYGVIRTQPNASTAVWRPASLPPPAARLKTKLFVTTQQLVRQCEQSSGSLRRVVVQASQLCDPGYLSGHPRFCFGRSRFGSDDPRLWLVLLHARQSVRYGASLTTPKRP